jgi:hypothetical protein
MPFTTNNEFVKFCRTYDEILTALDLAAERYAERVSYAIVQPCMWNRKEYKVVVLGGVAQYIAKIESKPGGQRSFSLRPHTALFAFAENAVKALGRDCPSSLSDGILRVDIFQTFDGRLVVNEFESLEACTYSTSITKQAVAESWMVDYWNSKLKESVRLVFA